MNKILRLGLFVTLLFLGGCVVPYSGEYYSPSASEGRVTGYGDWYAPTTLYLTRGKNVSIHVVGYSVIKSPYERQAIVIQMWVRPKAVLNIDVRNIAILNGGGIPIAHLSSFTVSSSDDLFNYESFATTDHSLRGDIMPSKYWTVYSLDYPFDHPPPDQFCVQLPAMRVGNTSYPSLTVKFTKTHGWWWQPLM